MRRKAQRANARQGFTTLPLRATARIAAEAAPTGGVLLWEARLGPMPWRLRRRANRGEGAPPTALANTNK